MFVLMVCYRGQQKIRCEVIKPAQFIPQHFQLHLMAGETHVKAVVI